LWQKVTDKIKNIQMKFRLVLALSLISSVSFCQKTENATLNKLVNSALAYSSRIKEQGQNVLLGETRTALLISQQQPTINSEIGVTRIDPVSKAHFPGENPISLQFQPNMNYNANIGASYVLFDWGKQKAGIDKSKLETNLSKTSTEALRNVIAYQVANLYYSIIFTKKAVEVQEEQVDLVNQNSVLIANKLKRGDAIEFDKVSIDVRLSNVNTRLVELQSQLNRQLINLSALVGSDANQLEINDERVNLENPLSFENIVTTAQQNNSDLKLINQRNGILEQDQRIINLSMKPTLAANAQVGIRNGYLPRINGNIPPIDQDFKFNTLLGAKLVIPIYNGRKKNILFQQTAITSAALRYNSEIINQGLERDIQLAQNDYLTAKNKLELSQKNIEQAEYALQLATTRFKNGLLTSLEIEKAQTDLKDAQFVKLQYQYQITAAQLEINRISGIAFWE
jgi:outer membrane protein TolC